MFARKHFLSEQTLDMLVDMRWQFACMLADIKLIGGNRGSSKGREWMDDLKQPFNAHANKQAVVHPPPSPSSLLTTSLFEPFVSNVITELIALLANHTWGFAAHISSLSPLTAARVCFQSACNLL